MTDDIKSKIIERLLGGGLDTVRGRSALAQSLIAPIRARVDYKSLGRNVFMVDELGFVCKECGLRHEDSEYAHSFDECVAYGVMDS